MMHIKNDRYIIMPIESIHNQYRINSTDHYIFSSSSYRQFIESNNSMSCFIYSRSSSSARLSDKALHDNLPYYTIPEYRSTALEL